MAAGRVGKDISVARNNGQVKGAGHGDENAIGGIAMNLPWQETGLNEDVTCERHNLDFWP